MGSAFLLTLIILILGAGIIFTAASYLLYWYEHQNNLTTIFDSQTEALKATRKGLLSGFAAQSMALSLLPVGAIHQAFQRNTPPQPQSTHQPVIMVHGLFHNSSAWYLYKHWFKAHGLTNCTSFYYSSTQSFEEISETLDTYMTAYFDTNPLARPVLIGHSLGGLLLRNWVSHSSDAQNVAGVITLGAPMHGSKLSPFSFRALGRHLDYRGELFTQISNTETAPTVPCIALYSPVDNMVLPQESVASPPEGWQSVRTIPVSHLAMLGSKSISSKVAELAHEMFELSN